jgi:hypothetical protein
LSRPQLLEARRDAALDLGDPLFHYQGNIIQFIGNQVAGLSRLGRAAKKGERSAH